MSKPNQTIDELVTEEWFSPYKVAKLESILRGKQIPPQKLYGYCRNGYIPFTTNSTGKMQISNSDTKLYLSKFA